MKIIQQPIQLGSIHKVERLVILQKYTDQSTGDRDTTTVLLDSSHLTKDVTFTIKHQEEFE
jgi:hypothetical protein